MEVLLLIQVKYITNISGLRQTTDGSNRHHPLPIPSIENHVMICEMNEPKSLNIRIFVDWISNLCKYLPPFLGLIPASKNKDSYTNKRYYPHDIKKVR